MKKQIKQMGNSIGITFDAEDKKIYGMKVGDVLDLTDMIIVGSQNFPSVDHKKLEDQNED